jgi:glucose/mannose-6-phosphate isomerase
VNLDEPARFSEVDSRDALADLEHVAEQWAEAAAVAPEPLDLTGIQTVVVAGMGGSGIAGDIVAVLAGHVLDVPVVVHKGYGLPAFVGAEDLVVAVSHSGETAETLDSAETALSRGARVIGISGGGQLSALCRSERATVYDLPRRTPPRHALPLLSVPVLALLGLHTDLPEAIDAVRAVTTEMSRAVPTADNEAKRVAHDLAAVVRPTVVGAQGIGAVAAYRLACQLAENAKLPAIYGHMPEAAHNVASSWSADDEPSGIVLLRDPEGEPPRLTDQLRALAALGRDCNRWTVELSARGSSSLSRLASLVALVDLVSVYTALALDRDPTPIPAIDRIKAEVQS